MLLVSCRWGSSSGYVCGEDGVMQVGEQFWLCMWRRCYGGGVLSKRRLGIWLYSLYMINALEHLKITVVEQVDSAVCT